MPRLDLATVMRGLAAPLQPIVRTFRTYDAADFPRDLTAGLTVAVVDLPQSMAFAVIAGVPPVYGIYTAIFLAFLGALFTSSRFLAVGPTNTQSLLVAAIVSRMTSDPDVYLQLVIGLSLIKGLVQLAFAAARMGQLVRYVSQSVMTGFTAGAGVLIFVEQIPPFLGISAHGEGSELPGVLRVLEGIATHLPDTQVRAAALGLGSLAVLAMGRRLPEWVPGPLLAVAGGAATVWLAGWTDVAVVGVLPRGLPSFQLPDINLAQVDALLPGAIAIALLGMLESVAIAKSIAQRTGQRIRADQEFFGQGFANVVGSFLQCMPGSGSFSRTALQYAVGARTRVASMVCAVANAVIFLTLAPAAEHIPRASLAAILFLVAYTLVDVRTIRRILRSGASDAAVCVVTFASALLLPLTYAIYVGIFLNLALYLRRAGQLHMLQMVPLDEGGFHERALEEGVHHADGVALFQLEGDLFFGVADELADRLREIVRSDAEAVVLRLKRSHFMDATVLFVLERFVAEMHGRGGHVLVCGLSPEVRGAMQRFGLEQAIGEGNVFDASASTLSAAREALARAQQLVQHTPPPASSQGTQPT